MSNSRYTSNMPFPLSVIKFIVMLIALGAIFQEQSFTAECDNEAGKKLTNIEFSVSPNQYIFTGLDEGKSELSNKEDYGITPLRRYKIISQGNIVFRLSLSDVVTQEKELKKTVSVTQDFLREIEDGKQYVDDYHVFSSLSNDFVLTNNKVKVDDVKQVSPTIRVYNHGNLTIARVPYAMVKGEIRFFLVAISNSTHFFSDHIHINKTFYAFDWNTESKYILVEEH